MKDGSFQIEIYGGYCEIGGNCVVIRDSDRKIVFDNGVRFSILKRYYRGRVQPLGTTELRSLGIIPPLEIFEDADVVYISHLHLDHLGLLGALPHGVKVFVPSLQILEVIEEWYRGSPTWLANLPHSIGVETLEIKPLQEDIFSVRAIPVSHSAYPSYSFIYYGYNQTVFYSGDLRANGPLGARRDTISDIRNGIDDTEIDVAFIEGTNIGDAETPIGADEFRSIINKLLMRNSLVTISVDPLDFEMLTAVSELATFAGRTLVLASPRIIDLAPIWLEEFRPKLDSGLGVAMELEKPVMFPTELISIRDDVFRSPGNYLVIQEPVGYLDMLRQMRLWEERLPIDSITVLTSPEPLEAEAEAEEIALVTWLLSLGVQVYRVRVSGHYYPFEFQKLVRAIKPRTLVPIHTKHPGIVHSLYKTLSSIT